MRKISLTTVAVLCLVVVIAGALDGKAQPVEPPVDPVGPPAKAKITLPLLGGLMWPRGAASTWGEDPLTEVFAKAKESGIGLAIWTYN